MEKIIKLGKQEVKLNNNFAWAMEYKDQYGKDILPVLLPLVGTLTETVASVLADSNGKVSISDVLTSLEGRSMEVLLPLYNAEISDLIGIMWAMAKVADENIDPPRQWIKQFDVFPLDIVVPTVFELAVKGSVSSKNLKRLKGLKASLKELQPSLQTTSSSPDSNEG